MGPTSTRRADWTDQGPRFLGPSNCGPLGPAEPPNYRRAPRGPLHIPRPALTTPHLRRRPVPPSLPGTPSPSPQHPPRRSQHWLHRTAERPPLLPLGPNGPDGPIATPALLPPSRFKISLDAGGGVVKATHNIADTQPRGPEVFPVWRSSKMEPGYRRIGCLTPAPTTPAGWLGSPYRGQPPDTNKRARGFTVPPPTGDPGTRRRQCSEVWDDP